MEGVGGSTGRDGTPDLRGPGTLPGEEGPVEEEVPGPVLGGPRPRPGHSRP